MTSAMLCSLCSEGLWHGLYGSLVSGGGVLLHKGKAFSLPSVSTQTVCILIRESQISASFNLGLCKKGN